MTAPERFCGWNVGGTSTSASAGKNVQSVTAMQPIMLVVDRPPREPFEPFNELSFVANTVREAEDLPRPPDRE
jgi:hypothetical protein